MFNSAVNTRLLTVGLHLVLGVLLLSGFITKIYSLVVVVVAVLLIFKSGNKNNEAMYWSAYMIGGEVLFRMSGGMIFHELPKYSVLLFLALGLLVEKRAHHISVSYVIYILLLLMGIVFVDIPFDESVRKAIAFNLSGPVLLGVAAIYFYKRPLHLSSLLDMLFVMLLPIISMLSLLYFRTPSPEEIVFGGEANFETSGGYGPNQVATLLGLGMFIFAVHLFFKRRIFGWFWLDVFFFAYITYRGLITLSRGGIITAVLALMAFTFFYILSQRNKLENLLKFSGLVLFFGAAIFIYTADVTGGMLVNRYTNKNASGKSESDITTGRGELFKSEMVAFMDNPFFGIGVGGGKYYRMQELDIVAASHNEMSRLIGEHGLLGIIALFILFLLPVHHILYQPLLARGLLGAFFIFWFLTINHSAMRIAFPAFIYGLSVSTLIFHEKNSVHRK